MIIALLFAWCGGLILVGGAIAASIVAARLRHPILATTALIPVGVAGVLLAFDAALPAPHPVLATLLAGGIALLGIVAGGPLAALVLGLASRPGPLPGEHGGILVDEPGSAPPREVLRGGTTIGYLERIAIVGGILLGRIEIIAVVVAIKGLGRFSELDRAETRERFIIGTLVSFIWAGACAAVVVLS